MIRVAVVDDQELSRDGFAMILDLADDMTVVGTAGDGQEGIELVRRERPDVTLMDVRMPRVDGLEATRTICEERLETRVLVLTTYDLDEYVYEALRAGASGFLLKDVSRHTLLDAVRRCHDEDLVLSPTVTGRLVEEYVRRTPRPAPRVLDRFSPREREILQLVAEGLTNHEIAEGLVVAVPTVKTHISRIMDKIGARDRVHVVIWAYENGVVSPGELHRRI